MKSNYYYNYRPISFTKRNFLEESLIPKYKRKYNKSGYVINEAVQDDELVQGFPINKPMKFDQALMVKAINYGMIILMTYRGDKDNWKGGRERTIYPMVLGVNKNTGNLLLRGWHLEGWSVKERRATRNVWRLFKTSNILQMLFTGDFFRMAPRGYMMNDRVMTERKIVAADFNVIRRNQQSLLNANKIQVQEEQTIGDERELKPVKIDVRNTDTQLDLVMPWLNNKYFDRRKMENIKLTILKSIFGNKYIAVIGARGTENRIAKVFEDKTLLGDFKVIKVIIGDEINRTKNVNGQRYFDLYTFNRIIVP